MNHLIDVQIACDDTLPVTDDTIISWAKQTLCDQVEACELTLRLVTMDEMTGLNTSYRKKSGPTNVLAFPANVPEGIDLEYHFLGDVIICPAVLASEAIEQQRPLEAHWAHIVVHGILHLLGHDHQEELETNIMQSLEIARLADMGFPNPYLTEESNLE